MTQKPRGFVIHFTARSGSTFIIFTLRKHPQIITRAEVFGNKKLPGNLPQTADNQIAFLRKYWRAYRNDSRHEEKIARGFKVQFARDIAQVKATGRFLKVCSEYDVARFFLYRRNRIKQLVSALRARQVKEVSSAMQGKETAHVYDDKLAAEVNRLPPLKINLSQFAMMLDSLERNYQLLANIRSKVADGIDLYYEDLMEDRQTFFDRMFDAIGVPSIDVTDSDETRKITSDNLRDVIANYDELAEYFAGTPYERQLEA